MLAVQYYVMLLHAPTAFIFFIQALSNCNICSLFWSYLNNYSFVWFCMYTKLWMWLLNSTSTISPSPPQMYNPHQRSFAISVASCLTPAKPCHVTPALICASSAWPGRSKRRQLISSKRSWCTVQKAGKSLCPVGHQAKPRGPLQAPEGPWTACSLGNQPPNPAPHLSIIPWKRNPRLARVGHTQVRH